jgi:hypothetical protein
MLGLQVLNQRLKTHIEIASGARDLPHRQRTMVATIAWSFELLTELERILFRRVAIFSGGATLEAIEHVCEDDDLPAEIIADVLLSLVEKSLLNVTPTGSRPRYAMLESVRAFASTELAKIGELVMMERARAVWLTRVAGRAREILYEESRRRWIAEFGPEIDNARGVLAWALSSPEDDAPFGRRQHPLRYASSLDTSRMERRVAPLVGGVLLKIDTNRHPVIVARLMAIQLRTMDGQSAISLAERAISLLERDGDRRGTILIMRNQSALHLTRGNLAKAQAAINRAFVFAAEQGLQRSRLFANLLVMRCTTRCYAGQLDKARSDLAELELPDADIGVEKSSLLMAQCVIAFFEGSYRRAADIIEASIGEAV